MTARARAATLTAAYYGVVFTALGAHLPYWPVWLDAWGLTTAELGWYLGAATVARIFGTIVVPAFADLYAWRRATIAATALATALAHALHMVIETPGWLLAATIAAAVTMAPAVPMGEALALRAAKRDGFSYARVRGVGSAGFLIANLAIGFLLAHLGPDVVLWTVVVGFGCVGVLGAMHPGGGAAPGEGRDRAGPVEVLRLFARTPYLAFALASTLGFASHTVYYVYSVLDWQAQGIQNATIGALWASGVALEIVVMLGPGAQWVRQVGPAGALAIGAAAGLVRWSAMTFEPGLALLWPLQGLHSLSFGLAHLGAMAFFSQALPGRMIASAQGMKYGAMGGALAAAVTALAGLVAGAFGIAAAYWLAAACAAGSLAAAATMHLTWRGECLAADG